MSSKSTPLISWTELSDQFGVGVAADGFALRGVVVLVEKAFWKRGISRVFFLRDADKEVRQISFDRDVVLPPETNRSIEMGAIVEIASPRYHVFLDQEKGIKITDASHFKIVFTADHPQARMSAEEEVSLGNYLKERGNQWLSSSNEERSINCFNEAIALLNPISTFSSACYFECQAVEEQTKVVSEARLIQGACASNLMFIGVKQKKWSNVIEIGEEILRLGVQESIRQKVFYRMGFALAKLGASEEAILYVQKARDVFPNEKNKDVELLYQQLSQADSGATSIRGLKELWQRGESSNRLDGMGKQFGYKPPMLESCEDARVVERLIVDISTCFAVPSLVNEETRMLKPRLLYLCMSERLSSLENRWMKNVLRVKTRIFLGFNHAVFPSSFTSKHVEDADDSVVIHAVPQPKVSRERCAADECELPTPGSVGDLPSDRVVFLFLDASRMAYSAWRRRGIGLLNSIGLEKWSTKLLRRSVPSFIIPWEASRVGENYISSPDPLLEALRSVLSSPANYPIVFCCGEPSIEHHKPKGFVVSKTLTFSVMSTLQLYLTCSDNLEAAEENCKKLGKVLNALPSMTTEDDDV